MIHLKHLLQLLLHSKHARSGQKWTHIHTQQSFIFWCKESFWLPVSKMLPTILTSLGRTHPCWAYMSNRLYPKWWCTMARIDHKRHCTFHLGLSWIIDNFHVMKSFKQHKRATRWLTGAPHKQPGPTCRPCEWTHLEADPSVPVMPSEADIRIASSLETRGWTTQ